MYLNNFLETELISTLTIPDKEILAESISFDAGDFNFGFAFDINVPFTVHSLIKIDTGTEPKEQSKGTYRVYLDGDGYLTSGPYSGLRWNGLLLGVGSAYLHKVFESSEGRLTANVKVPMISGNHALKVMFSSPDVKTIGTIRGLRHYAAYTQYYPYPTD